MSSGIKFQLPDVASYCPFKHGLNPHLDAVAPDSYAWLKSLGYVGGPRLEKSRAEWFAAASFPDVDKARMRIASDYFILTIDGMVDAGEVEENEGDADSSFKRSLAFYGMFERLLEATSPTQAAQERFIKATDLHVKNVTKEKVNRSARSDVTLDEHIRIRRATSGGHVLWAFMEILLGINLPNEVRSNEDVVRLVEYLIDIPSWCGDLYAFKHGLSRGDMNNIVPLAMKEFGFDLQVAVEYVDQRIRSAIDDYVALKAALPSWGAETDGELGKYLTGCEYGVSAFIHYGLNSNRYFEAKELQEVKSMGWVTIPSEGISKLDRWLK